MGELLFPAIQMQQALAEAGVAQVRLVETAVMVGLLEVTELLQLFLVPL